jgi:hypothetical protein
MKTFELVAAIALAVVAVICLIKAAKSRRLP